MGDLWTIPVGEWNGQVRMLERATPLQGRNCVLRAQEGGVVVNHERGVVLHPWSLQPFWSDAIGDEKTGYWRVKVTPGFVNGYDPAIDMQAGLLAGASVWGNEYGKTPIKPGDPGTLQVLLTDEIEPYLTVTSWRNVISPQANSAAFVNGRYPEFFNQLDVLQPEQLPPEIDAGGVLGGTTDLPKVFPPIFPVNPGTRGLLAADIVLTVDKPAAIETIDPQTNAASVLGYTIALPLSGRYGARLNATTQYSPPSQEQTTLDRLLGTYVEPTAATLLIGTIWMVAPENPVDANVPDPSWQPFVQHNVFWNLLFATLNPALPNVDQPIQFFLPLAGGVAQPIIDALLEPINEVNAAIQAALSTFAFTGNFWNG